MHKRHDVQRQHIIDSLDNLIFQLYTLSFFLSPTLLPLLCRVASQFVFYKPRELDPKLSLRVWFLLLCAANAPSFWSHARDGATEGRTVVLDFVGMGYLPSKLHLVLLDTLILVLQMVLTTISFEISLHLSSPSAPESSAIPASPKPSSSSTSSAERDRDNDDDERKGCDPYKPSIIVDLRLSQVIHRLRSPTPLSSRIDLTPLPLPNTTPTPLSMHLRSIVRRRDEMRRRMEGQSEPTESRGGTSAGTGAEGGGRTIPGSITTGDAE